jgi:predicted permease
MDIKMKFLVFIIDLLAPLAVGYFCRCRNVGKEAVFNKMILNNILVIYPTLSFLSFWVLPLTYDLIWLPVMGVLMGIVPGLVAYVVAQYKYTSDLDRGSYVMSAILSNLGTIGGLCVFLLYGETGYAYQQLVVLFQYILMFMFCYPLAQYYYQRAQEGAIVTGVSVRSVLFSRNQLAIVGILCGAVLQKMGVPRPQELGGLVEALIHIGAWTALIPVGYSIDFDKLKKHYREIRDITIIKFLVTPLVIYGLAGLVITDDKMLKTILVLSCMPTAINAVITSRIYDLNIHISVAAFILTTIVFLLIVYPALFIGLSI